MAFRVFLAHRASPRDSPLVTAIHDGLTEQGVECFVAENYREPGRLITEKIEDAILNCDVVIVLWTKEAAASAFVNQEVGFAKARRKLVIPFVEAGVKLEAFLHGTDLIEFGRDTIEKAINTLDEFVNGLKLGKEQKQLILGICVAVLGIIALFFVLMTLRE